MRAVFVCVFETHRQVLGSSFFFGCFSGVVFSPSWALVSLYQAWSWDDVRPGLGSHTELIVPRLALCCGLAMRDVGFDHDLMCSATGTLLRVLTHRPEKRGTLLTHVVHAWMELDKIMACLSRCGLYVCFALTGFSALLFSSYFNEYQQTNL